MLAQMYQNIILKNPKAIFLILIITVLLVASIQTGGLLVERLTNPWKNKSITIDGEKLTTGILPPSFEMRLLSWQSSWKGIEASPVIGTGIGTYSIVSPPLRHFDDPDPGYFAHNEYIQFWLETGLIGLSLIILIAITILRLFLFLLRHIDLKLQDRLEITGLIAGLFSVAIQSFFDFHFHIIAILMIMGFMCARVQEISHIYNPKLIRGYNPAQKLSRKSYFLAASIIPIFMLNYSVPTAIADYYLNKAKRQIEAGEIESGDLRLMLAGKCNPNSIPIFHFIFF